MLLDDELPTTQTPYSTIIQYWEKKRFVYNAIVGAFGLTLLVLYATKSRVTGFDVFFVLAFSIAANVCYSFGCYALLGLKYYDNYRINYIYWSRLLIVVGTLISLWAIVVVSVGLGAEM